MIALQDGELLASRARALLAELMADPVARRRFRRDSVGAVGERLPTAPAPPCPLPVQIMGLSVYLSDADLLGRRVSRPTAPTAPVAVGLLLCILDARPAALIHVPEVQAEEVAALARSQGFSSLLSPTAIAPEADPARAGFADSAAHSWPAWAGSGGWRAVLVSRSPEVVLAAWLSMVFGWDEYLGVLLGYPNCCSAAFARRWERASANHRGDMAFLLIKELIAKRSAQDPARLPWTANSLVRILGAGVPLHFPCRPDCPATAELTRWHLCVLNWIDPELVRSTTQLLQSPVIVAKTGEVHVLGRSTYSAGSRTVEHDVALVRSSTTASAVATLVRHERRFCLTDLAELDARLVLPDANTGTGDDPHAVPVLAFAGDV